MSAAVAMIAYAESKKVEIRVAEGKVRLSGSPQNVAHVADALKQYRDELLRSFQQAVAKEKRRRRETWSFNQSGTPQRTTTHIILSVQPASVRERLVG